MQYKKHKVTHLEIDAVVEKALKEKANPNCKEKGCFGRGYTGIYRGNNKHNFIIRCSCTGKEIINARSEQTVEQVDKPTAKNSTYTRGKGFIGRIKNLIKKGQTK